MNTIKMDKIDMDEWYKKNKCLDKARLFVLCMKETPKTPLENKCKKIFDLWNECIHIDKTWKYIHENGIK